MGIQYEIVLPIAGGADPSYRGQCGQCGQPGQGDPALGRVSFFLMTLK